MRFTHSPRSRDEWLEPPDDDGEQDRFTDYISENYKYIGEFCGDEVYYSEDREELGTVNFDDWEWEEGSYSSYCHEIDDHEVAWEIALEYAREKESQ
jgi:hypothetical protein